MYLNVTEQWNARNTPVAPQGPVRGVEEARSHFPPAYKAAGAKTFRPTRQNATRLATFHARRARRVMLNVLWRKPNAGIELLPGQ